MKPRASRTAWAVLSLVLSCALGPIVTPVTSTAAAAACLPTGLESVSLDKPYHAANETVTISGDGFMTTCTLSVVVTRPDGSTHAELVVTDAAGALTHSYFIGVLEGPHTTSIASPDGTPLVQVSFDVGPVVLLDKGDYQDGETVHVSGYAFPPHTTFSVQVTRPDGSVVTGDGTNTPGTDSVTTDAAGSFGYDYIIRDGVREVYEVDVVRDGISLANTSFTDSTAFVQRIGTAVSAASTSTSVSVSTPVGTGHSIIVAVALDVDPGAGASCSDNAGNTYQTDVIGGRVFICSAHNVAASPTTITASYAAAGLSTMLATEFSGLAAVDKAMIGGLTNSNTPTSGVTATTAQAEEVLFGAVSFNGNQPTLTFTPGSGACTGAPTQTYTSMTNGPAFPRGYVENGGRNLAAEYAITTTTGNYAACGTLSSARQWSAVIATYKAIVDNIAPTTTITLSPASPDGDNGWYIASVGVTVTAVDNAGGTGVAETRCQLGGAAPASFDALPPGPCTIGTVATDGTYVVYAASKDHAGNKEAVRSRSVKIDTTAPATTITLSPSAPDGTNDWYTVGVGVAVSGVDGGSSLAETRCQLDGAAPASFAALPAAPCSIGTVTAEGVHIVYAASRDEAGNTGAVQSRPFQIDSTPPSTTITLNPATPDGTNGWYKSDVGVTVAGTDVVSGVAETRCQLDGAVPGSFTALPAGACSLEAVTTEGMHTVYAASKDAAGNTEASVNSASLKIDKTAPTLTWSSAIYDGEEFYFGFVPTAPTCTAQDTLSGPESCVVTGYSTAVGTHTLTGTALDKAGNQYQDAGTYTVLAWTLKGFYAPVENAPGPNTVKGGSTVPFKFEVFAGTTELTDPAVVKQPLKAIKVTCGTDEPTDEIQLLATGGTALRYDAVSGQFIYNWQTPRQPGACYLVTVETQDGSKLTASFKLK